MMTYKMSTFNTMDFTAKMSLDLLKLHLTFVKIYCNIQSTGFSGGSDSEESACNTGDLVSIPGLGRSPGERHGNSLQYPCLKNPMDRGSQGTIVHMVAQSRTQLK